MRLRQSFAPKRWNGLQALYDDVQTVSGGDIAPSSGVSHWHSQGRSKTERPLTFYINVVILVIEYEFPRQ